MSDSADNVWNSSEAPSAGEDDLPPVLDLLTQTGNDVLASFAEYLLGGLALMVIVLPVSFLAVFGAYGGMVAGMMPGLMAEDENLALIGGMGGFFLVFGLLMVVLMVGLPPLQASICRAVWAKLVHDEPLTFGAAFSTWRQDAGRVIAYNFLVGVAVFVGILMCYLPGLAVGMLLSFAAPAIYVHRLSIGDAVRLSVNHVKDHLVWHIGFHLLGVVMIMILSYLPMIGVALTATVYYAYILRAYRHFFGDGELPRGYQPA